VQLSYGCRMTTYRDELDQSPLYGGSGTYGYAIVDVTIQGVTEDKKLTGPVATERALIDTGSTDTTIHPDLVRELSLKQVGNSVGEDPMTDKREPVPNYHICLTIPKLEAQWGDLYAPVRAPDLYVQDHRQGRACGAHAIELGTPTWGRAAAGIIWCRRLCR
jgi:hypothetical protein